MEEIKRKCITAAALVFAQLLGYACPVAFIVFFIIRLCGQSAWSWWWVTSPLWGIPAAIILAVVALLLYARTGE